MENERNFKFFISISFNQIQSIFPEGIREEKVCDVIWDYRKMFQLVLEEIYGASNGV